MMIWQKSRARTTLIVLMVLLALAGVGSVTADQMFLRDSRILPNIFVGYVDVGGLTKEEAAKKLTSVVSSGLPPVVITDGKDVWLVPARDINLVIDVDKSIETAYSAGRSQNFIQRWQDRWSSQSQPQQLPVQVDFERTKLAKVIAPLADQTDRQARSASLSLLAKSKEVAVSPAVVGRRLNVGKTVAEAFTVPQQQMAFVVELKFDTEQPPLTDEQFSGINTMLATYSTSFRSWDTERNANLRLAAERIHGKRLNPGDVFSYNDTVGTRTQKQGFRMAPVILNGKLVPDWGGGVCQVSSTLYNAVLLANMDIVDRSNHGRAIGYVPLGFDATVVDGLIDFKFRNNLKNPVLIYTTVTEDELFFFVLGDAKDAPPPIELDYVVHKVYEPIEVKQPDPTLESGKEVIEESPQRGFRVSTYRIRKINGKEERQLLATDDYDPVNRIIKVGTKNADGQASPSTIAAKAPDKPQGQSPSGTITLQKPAAPTPQTPQKPVKR